MPDHSRRGKIMRRWIAVSGLLLSATGWLGSVPIAVAGHGPGHPGQGNSSAAHSCQHGGYRSLVGADGTTFRNTGACVSFAAHGGKFATGLVIPAGKVATLSGAQFGGAGMNCPSDPLAYGYQLNLGANVQVATGNGCTAVAGATIGPVPTATLLRIWLTDMHPPAYTFYSDGSHALVTGSNPWTVSIMDSLFGTVGPAVPRPPTGPGLGNFNVTVTVA